MYIPNQVFHLSLFAYLFSSVLFVSNFWFSFSPCLVLLLASSTFIIPLLLYQVIKNGSINFNLSKQKCCKVMGTSSKSCFLVIIFHLCFSTVLSVFLQSYLYFFRVHVLFSIFLSLYALFSITFFSFHNPSVNFCHFLVLCRFLSYVSCILSFVFLFIVLR